MPYQYDENGGLWEVDAQGNRKWRVDAQGNPVGQGSSGAPAARAPVTIDLPPSPTQIRQNNNEEERIKLEKRRQAIADEKNAREEMEWLATHNPDGFPKPQIASSPRLSAETRQRAIAQSAAADQLDAVIADLRAKYEAGPGSTSGVSAVKDYFPTPKNQQFDRAANAARGIVRNALGLTGGEANTAAEAQMNLGAYIPQASDYDATILDSIGRLEGLRDSARNQARQVLGGSLDANGNIIETPVLDNPERMQVAGGATRRVPDPELSARLNGMFAKGASLDEINAYLDTVPGSSKVNPSDYNAMLDWARKHPGYQPFSATREEPISWLDQMGNKPLAAVGRGVGSGLTGGILEAVSPDKFAVSRAANPGSMLAGEMAGAILGSEGIGLGARAALKGLAPRLAPKLLKGGRMAALGPEAAASDIMAARKAEQLAAAGRQAAQDAAYGGVYGGTTQGDPLTGAAMGALGSLGGQIVGKGVGTAVGGVRSATIDKLRALNIPLTPGMLAKASLEDAPSTIGVRRAIASSEDTLANTSIANAAIRGARRDAYEAGNNALFRESANGAPISGVGIDALRQLEALKTRKFADAAEGVSIPRNDPKYLAQLQGAIDYGTANDAARARGDFGIAMQQGFNPIFKNPEVINGKELQDALRYTQSQAGAWSKAANGLQPDPSAIGISEAFSKVNDALVGASARSAPKAIPKLKEANRLFRNLKIMDNATSAAASEGGVASPMQVITAMKANNSALGQGRGLLALSKQPLYDLASTLQQVLPNDIPPTGVNAAPALALAGLAAGGAGYATDNDALKALAAATLLTTPYTKLGRGALDSALFKRPELLKKAGALIRKRKGLLGSAAVPLLLESQQ